MFVTKAMKTHRVLGSKIALVSAVSLSLAAGAAAVAAPAQAAGTERPSISSQASSLFITGRITADKPYEAGSPASGPKSVAYAGRVFIPSRGLVQVKQERWERDQWPDRDDYLGTSYFSKYLPYGGTFTFKGTHVLKRTDFGFWDRTEEVYQKVSYRVYKNGHWSPWSSSVYSSTAIILR
ncbi:hypothetical protein [Arthrobacter sp. ISL-65]|uniref:hypothetical protein n=1 Tax=Arthrobacter sp. ISL-65 TaxID=2819112 RepID=UPI001BEBF990|nr:hypothetical protein [Arthrobacter sp. ISL-65]MBT2548149.1 hypothetical protein [Arthrobacter sp. ISL-65]